MHNKVESEQYLALTSAKRVGFQANSKLLKGVKTTFLTRIIKVQYSKDQNMYT